MIIPKQFLKTIKRTGLGVNLFDEMRYDDAGAEIPDFILNKGDYRNSQIIIAQDNFGCGSSREHAPWALMDFGIKAIIAPSFADIFFNNCFKNGILPIILPSITVQKLLEQAEQTKLYLKIDLDNQKITLVSNKGGDENSHNTEHSESETSLPFEIDKSRKKYLQEGLDDIAITLQKGAEISQYEERQKQNLPWLFT
jgi:3-isopropylmalate/(R)-2-methylmalate dehydratase small subunit